MSQRDGKLHSGFHGLSIAGVLLFYQWDNALKKFVEHRRGDSQEVVKGDLVIQTKLLHQLMIMSSPGWFLVFSVFFAVLQNHCILVLLLIRIE